MGEPLATSAFLRTLAHDLDNVLAGIRGALEIVTSQAPDGACADFARAALVDLARADALIHDAVDYAALPPLEPRGIEVARVMNEAIHRAQPAAAARSVKVQAVSTAPGAFVADVDRLARALGELIENAVEASAPGTTVHVRTDMTSAGLVIEIDDTGMQRPDARSFEPFFSTKRGHAGLGLALAKRIVEAHGGSIELAPVEGGGTRARMRLPRDNRTAPAGSHPS